MKKMMLLLAAAIGFSVAAEVPLKGFLSPRVWRKQQFAQLVKEKEKIVALKLLPGISRASVWAMDYPLDGGKDINTVYEGISFEVKGDGSDEWGNIVIGENQAFLGHWYFPLKNKEWKKYTVSFADMAPANDYSPGLLHKMPVTRLCTINFGDYWRITWCNARRAPFSYQVRNLALVKKVAPKYPYGKYRKAMPLAEAVKKMKSNSKVQISCFGDSITAGTCLRKGEKRYAELLEEMLAAKYKNPNIKSVCVAVGGARTKDSIAWMERDFTRGTPDVATMLIGYNNRSGGQSAEMYRKQLEIWIDHLLARTKGKTAIILIPTLPGIPRWYGQDDMAKMVYEVAQKYNCTVVPLEKMIKKMGPFEYRKKYLADGVHPNQAGHKLFAEEIVKYFK